MVCAMIKKKKLHSELRFKGKLCSNLIMLNTDKAKNLFAHVLTPDLRKLLTEELFSAELLLSTRTFLQAKSSFRRSADELCFPPQRKLITYEITVFELNRPRAIDPPLLFFREDSRIFLCLQFWRSTCSSADNRLVASTTASVKTAVNT
jgi:hypothetical protein